LPRSAFDRDQIAGNTRWSHTSLIAITSTARLRSQSYLLYKLGLIRHLAASYTVLHATRWGQPSQHHCIRSQLCVVVGGEDQEVPEWALQWLVARNRTRVYQLQGGQPARPRGLAANCLHVVSKPSLVV